MTALFAKVMEVSVHPLLATQAVTMVSVWRSYCRVLIFVMPLNLKLMIYVISVLLVVSVFMQSHIMYLLNHA